MGEAQFRSLGNNECYRASFRRPLGHGVAGQQSGMAAPLHPNDCVSFWGLNSLDVYRAFIWNILIIQCGYSRKWMVAAFL